ncbi:hypothetical protein P280DRAFT_83410 [Massarina eburnea CBS 473.64]|uniref:Uncharacterized protein n=1 Tax=Massarina eburnea CBS 473.64 TaxID=1395130 RepID=A0A6A6RTM7_9PLEO|nr:hypothetical protein P280DRAFT_83410 [Massarina eburnea CBS 473.64]
MSSLPYPTLLYHPTTLKYPKHARAASYPIRYPTSHTAHLGDLHRYITSNVRARPTAPPPPHVSHRPSQTSGNKNGIHYLSDRTRRSQTGTGIWGWTWIWIWVWRVIYRCVGVVMGL